MIRRGRLLAAAILLLSPFVAAPIRPARAQETPEAGRALMKARELLRSGKVEDRVEAIQRLIELDSGAAILCLEEAIQRSATEMEKLSRDVDAVDIELADAEWEMEDCKDYPSLLAEKEAVYKVVKAKWDDLTARMRGNLDICLNGARSFASFRSPDAVDRIARGATSSVNPLSRQMYIQALGAPGREDRIPVLLELLKSGESRIRAASVRALRAFRPRREVFDAVLPLLKDRNWSVRVGAAEVVARAPLDFALPALVEAAERETGEPCLQVDSLLHSLTGVSFGGSRGAWKAWWARNGEAVAAGGWRRAEESAPAEDSTKSEAAFFSIPIESDNFLLVLDLSGSMTAEMTKVDARTQKLLDKHGFGPSRLAVALVQAYALVESIPAASRVNLMTFSEKVTRFGTKSALATSSLRKNALAWLNGQKTGRMTNIWDALRQGFGDHMAAGGATRFDELPDTIVFLTDGIPTAGRFRDEQSLCDLVEIWNASAGVVIHCVGIGEEFDEDLLERLTSSTGGYYMDTRTSRIRGTRARAEVPEDRRCPAVVAMATDVRGAYESGNADERIGMIPWLAALCTWTDEGLPVLALGLEDQEPGIPDAAASGLAALGARGIPTLVAALSGDSPRGPLAAARALGEMGPAAASAIPDLEKAAAKGNDIGDAATKALAKIRAKPKGK